MSKFKLLISAVALLCGTAVWAQAPSIAEKNYFAGVAADVTNFSAGTGDFTLEMEGTAATAITFYMDTYGDYVTYTPAATATVRFVRTGGIVYVYEGGAYVSTLTPTEATDVTEATLVGASAATYLEGTAYAPLSGTLQSVITNNSFETGNTDGWTIAPGAEGQYGAGWSATGMDGTYVYNTWSPDANAREGLYQTVTLDQGCYTLTALLTAWTGKTVMLYAGDSEMRFISSYNGNDFEEATLKFYVGADGTSVSIGAYTLFDQFFKADKFEIRKIEDGEAAEYQANQLQHYEFNASDWGVGDAGRAAQSAFSYDTEANTFTVNASGANNISFDLRTSNRYYIDSDETYLVVEAVNLNVYESNRLWFINSDNEGGNNSEPLYKVYDKNKAYFVWKLDGSDYAYDDVKGNRLWLTDADILGSGNYNWNTNPHFLNSDDAHCFLFGMTSTGSSATITNIDFITSSELSTLLFKPRAYTELNDMISACTTINKTIRQASLTTAIATAQAVINGEDSEQAVYSDAYDALISALNDALYFSGDIVDVTPAYVLNPSFESQYVDPWIVVMENGGTESSIKANVNQYVTSGIDGNYQLSLWNGGNIAASVLQNLTDLAKGKYTISALVSSNTGNTVTLNIGSASATANPSDGATYTSVTTPELDLLATGGSVQIGLASTDTWFKTDAFKLTYIPRAVKTELKAVYTTGNNLKDFYGAADSSLDNALDAALAVINNTEATQAEVDAALAVLQPLVQGYYTANRTWDGHVAGDGGEYYLYNIQTGTYMVGANDWGTRASCGDYTSDAGILTTLEKISDGVYTISTSPTYTDMYVTTTSTSPFVDGAIATNWTFSLVPGLEDAYQITSDYGTMTYGIDADYPTAITCAENYNTLNTYWVLVSKADRVDSLQYASINNPLNASFYIINPDFSRIANDDGYWTYTNGDVVNDVSDHSYEGFNTNFNVQQTLTGLKTGLYRFRTSGFYRNGSTAGNTSGGSLVDYYADCAFKNYHRGKEQLNAAVFAGTEEAPVMSIFDDADQTPVWSEYAYNTVLVNEVPDSADKRSIAGNIGVVVDECRSPWYPNSTGNAQKFVKFGYYKDNYVYFYSDGSDVNVGIKNENFIADDWTFFDHARLEYLGDATGYDAAYASAMNAFTKAKKTAEQFIHNKFELRADRATDYVEGGTIVYGNELQAKVDNYVDNLMSMTTEQINAAATDLVRETSKSWLRFTLAEWYFFDVAGRKLAATPIKTETPELVAKKAEYDAKMAEGAQVFTLSEGILDADTTTAVGFAAQRELLLQTIEEAKVNIREYISFAYPADETDLDISLLLYRPDLTGIELWCEPGEYGWYTDLDCTKDSTDANGYAISGWEGNFNIHHANNTYQGHDAFFAERFQFANNGLGALDGQTGGWAIYEVVKLPAGAYRFTAAAFAQDQRGFSDDLGSLPENAYLGVGLADGSEPFATFPIQTTYLESNTIVFDVTSDMDGRDLKVGIYLTDPASASKRANWVGLGYMQLIKIPEVIIREEVTYQPYRDQYSGLYKDSDFYFAFSEHARVKMHRTFTPDTWSTFVSPCNMSAEDIRQTFGDHAVVNSFTGSSVLLFPEDNKAIVDLNFEEVTSMTANVPYLLWVSAADSQISDQIELAAANDVNAWIFSLASSTLSKIEGDDAPVLNPDNGPFTMIGVYDGKGNITTVNNDDNGGFILPQPDAENLTASYYLVKGSDGATHFRYVPTGVVQRTRGLRAYFQYDGSASGIKAENLGFNFNMDNSVANSIKAVENAYKENVATAKKGVYTLNGVLVTSDTNSIDMLPKGIYIVNGKKTVVK